MDKQYRMADVFEIPLIFPPKINGEMFKFNSTGYPAEAAAQAVNTHDAMQDRIAELEKYERLYHNRVIDTCESEKLAGIPEHEAGKTSVQIVNKLKQDLDQLKAQNAELLQCLIERDGGDHDMDCKVQTRSCNCGHSDVMQLINKSSAACLDDHNIQLLTRLKDKCEGDHPHWGRTHIFIGEQIERLRNHPTPTDISTQVVDEQEWQ